MSPYLSSTFYYGKSKQYLCWAEMTQEIARAEQQTELNDRYQDPKQQVSLYIT